MGIPIANIYYLLCYAWDEFAPQRLSGVAAEEFTDTLHLFFHLLVIGIRTLHRQGPERGYMVTDEPISTVRGRILMGETIRLLNTHPKKVCCSFDEMSADILSNQILRATVKRLLGEESLKQDRKRRAELRQTLTLLSGIRDIELNARLFQEVRLHQNNRLYSFLINVCRFFYESLEAEEQPGQYRFRDVSRDPERMRRIFEKFVRNLFVRKQAQTGFRAKSDTWDWSATALSEADLRLLPQMRSDVSLRSADRTIIIECKYTESLYQRYYFAEKLRSEHLYQLCAYLRNLDRQSPDDSRAEGVLLYPTAGVDFDQSYVLQGHRVRIRTLDLNRPWIAIESQLLTLVGLPHAQKSESTQAGKLV
jgi:5-methylcytosine-specific restriction enzyme subunit McrC